MDPLESALRGTNLDPLLIELVRTQVSLRNGCRFCWDMHSRAATALGVSPNRLQHLGVWETATCYSESELAAFALTAALTTCVNGVDDRTIDRAREHFDDVQLAQLVYVIAAINAWNRIAVANDALRERNP